MERSLTPPGKDEEEEEKVQVKVLESPEKGIFYIYHPSHFLQQLLKSLFKCLGFHEISVPNNKQDSKSFNAAASEQYDVAPSSPSQQASDPPSTTTTDQQIVASTLARRTPPPTRGPGPEHN